MVPSPQQPGETERQTMREVSGRVLSTQPVSSTAQAGAPATEEWQYPGEAAAATAPAEAATAQRGTLPASAAVGRLADAVDRLRRELRQAHAEADGRALIDLAKGILVERLGCSPTEAAGQLRGLADQAGVVPSSWPPTWSTRPRATGSPTSPGISSPRRPTPRPSRWECGCAVPRRAPRRAVTPGPWRIRSWNTR